jgi:hypothetical protein
LHFVLAGVLAAQKNTSMPRQLRIEYAGAIYHALNRGDWREEPFEKG